ncbi:AraC family transcriptional regulator [Bradyrhizobium manausense]|uniref:AraC family transcriptional regulator n=1 Tax=Bradyrhizobium manausense TaxID=989370 RepID=UPI001BAA393E|nr:AraC family transcriptional regulator [Bradyrhizobium manausense]MBR0831331.1 AraC family transcriptional regulator [Bradyrhizobium manausense]
MRKGLAKDLSSIPSATGGIARLAYNRLREAGADLAPVMSGAGLTSKDIQDENRRVGASAQVRMLELAAKEMQDDCFGFHLARDFELGEIGLLYYVMASSERLGDALQNAERYCAINNEGVRLRVSLRDRLAIGFEYFNIDRLSDRHHMEFWLVSLVRICRTLSSGRLAPNQIRLKHFRPGTPSDVRSHLGCEIEFGANRDEILFGAAIGALPVLGADVRLNTLLLRYADEALSNRAARRTSIRSQVEDQIAQLLPHGKANASEIARRLGMSRRTLARALSAEDAAFSGVLETLRQALAKRYLRERDLPISEIAWLLGYGEISSFTHAFARWTGSTPTTFRNLRDVR